MKRPLIYLATVLCICTASSAYAHHSHPLFYDQCKTLKIEGRVESVQWKNPHVLILVRTDDGTTYTAEWTAVHILTTMGVIGPARAALTAGARVVVTANPLRDPAQIRASYPNIQEIVNMNVVDMLQIRRSDDSWNWTLPTLPECK